MLATSKNSQERQPLRPARGNGRLINIILSRVKPQARKEKADTCDSMLRVGVWRPVTQRRTFDTRLTCKSGTVDVLSERLSSGAKVDTKIPALIGRLGRLSYNCIPHGHIEALCISISFVIARACNNVIRRCNPRICARYVCSAVEARFMSSSRFDNR